MSNTLKWTPELLKEVIEVIERHTVLQRALDELNMTRSQVGRAFHRAGLQSPATYLKAEETECEACGFAPEVETGDKTKWTCTVIAGDFHIPFHHKDAVHNLIEMLGDVQPDKIVLNGDILDCYSLSDFAKKPVGMPSFQDEIDQTVDILKDIRNQCPNADITFMEGNHEKRLERVILRTPSLYGLKVLNLADLLGLRDLNIKHVGYPGYVQIGALTVKHGDTVSNQSGSTGRKEIENKGFDHVVMGHVHRVGWYHKTGYRRHQQALENGGLFDKSQCEYDPNPNWQMGFCVAWTRGDEVELCPIYISPDTGGFFYGPRRYGA